MSSGLLLHSDEEEGTAHGMHGLGSRDKPCQACVPSKENNNAIALHHTLIGRPVSVMLLCLEMALQQPQATIQLCWPHCDRQCDLAQHPQWLLGCWPTMLLARVKP